MFSQWWEAPCSAGDQQYIPDREQRAVLRPSGEPGWEVGGDRGVGGGRRKKRGGGQSFLSRDNCSALAPSLSLVLSLTHPLLRLLYSHTHTHLKLQD